MASTPRDQCLSNSSLSGALLKWSLVCGVGITQQHSSIGHLVRLLLPPDSLAATLVRKLNRPTQELVVSHSPLHVNARVVLLTCCLHVEPSHAFPRIYKLRLVQYTFVGKPHVLQCNQIEATDAGRCLTTLTLSLRLLVFNNIIGLPTVLHNQSMSQCQVINIVPPCHFVHRLSVQQPHKLGRWRLGPAAHVLPSSVCPWVRLRWMMQQPASASAAPGLLGGPALDELWLSDLGC